MRSFVDHLAGADPSRLTARWAIPTWLASLLFHGGILAAVLIAFPRLTRGLPAPENESAREVGIVLKSDQDSEVVFESQDKVFRERPTPTEPRPSDADELDEPILQDAQKSSLPRLETELLATAGALPTPDLSAPPRGSEAVGGAMSRTTFWKVESVGASFVFVIDRSASMSHRGSLELAKKELFQALDQLSDQSKFQVVFYNTEAFLLPMGDGRLIEATPALRARAKKEIERITPEGGTNHARPLELAFRLRPEVIYFLTDADMLSEEDVSDLTRLNREAPVPATVFAIEFGNGPNLSSRKPLRRLAADNDGIYSYVNVGEFGSTPESP